ncbi:uncharacterized protein TRIVIDRAFT_66126 [Trichoderma virens Gv29-8]|uniref:Uncharacterized protein n=1 Tax=Hypocrea virens (strain Gv29-8 / FGSC 10586) TaxID=413071 RepID=G9N860_HYPVG|nr:uncharacterized protein TRIVIDRAFT_66126 [Trichoderma virens Gv29-8]EHK17398.1 hypothetical protein TRIVIDRAFT_66126 [Trichoderma virens Gv29-8]UKZ55587.1 hypothetical protein TrVGV298_009411 [Trichoderma virens]
MFLLFVPAHASGFSVPGGAGGCALDIDTCGATYQHPADSLLSSTLSELPRYMALTLTTYTSLHEVYLFATASIPVDCYCVLVHIFRRSSTHFRTSNNTGLYPPCVKGSTDVEYDLGTLPGGLQLAANGPSLMQSVPRLRTYS